MFIYVISVYKFCGFTRIWRAKHYYIYNTCVCMTTQRIAVSLSKNDYAYLNYIRQGYLYADYSISDLPEIGNILKSISLYGALLISSPPEWEEHGRYILHSFFSEKRDEKALKNLPVTQAELIISLEKNRVKKVLKATIESLESRPSKKTQEGFNFNGGMDDNINHDRSMISDHGLSNYILTLKDEEMELINFLKMFIESFSDNSFSNSEIIRFIFRYFFVDPKIKTPNQQTERNTLLASFFIFGLYGFTPIEAVLLRVQIADILGFRVPREKINTLKKIYNDQTLFDIYIESIKKIIKEKSNSKNKGIASKLKGTKLMVPPLFSDIKQNMELQGKYKSIISGISFHSSFIGYTLLELEWHYFMHNIPLLSTYLYSSVNNVTIGTFDMLQVFEYYQESFKMLFELSKKTNTDDSFLFE